MRLSDEERVLILKNRKETKRNSHGFMPDDLAAISTEEKCEEFDKLFEMALEEYRHVEEHGHDSKDFEHWCYEAVMKLIGDKVFDGINAYL